MTKKIKGTDLILDLCCHVGNLEHLIQVSIAHVCISMRSILLRYQVHVTQLLRECACLRATRHSIMDTALVLGEPTTSVLP